MAPADAARIDALVARFVEIGETAMRDLPLYNQALVVEALGFRRHGDDLVGVVITPWFMNVIALPVAAEPMEMNRMGKKADLALPSGPQRFKWGGDETVGAYKSLSLFSPMFGFDSQDTARAAATDRLKALMTPPPEDAGSGKDGVSRRDLFRGRASE